MQDGETALHHAIDNPSGKEDIDMVRLLWENGADINSKTKVSMIYIHD